MIPPGCFIPARSRSGSWILSITACVCLLACLSLLLPVAARSAAPQRALVSVSIYPLALLVSAVGGEPVRVSTLLPPGASPHGFEPTPRQVKSLARADLVITVGGGLDPWAKQAIRAVEKKRPHLVLARSVGIADVTPDANGHDHHHGQAEEFHGGGGASDPHLWLDPLLVRDVIVPELVTALSRLVPDSAPLFAERGAAFQEQLTRLDQEIAARLAPYADRPFVAFHGSWGRFARHYGLNPVGVVMPFPGRAPSARQMAHVIQTAREAGAAAVLIEPQFNPRIARTLAEQFGAKLVLVDPMGHPDKPYGKDYISLMRFNGAAFEEALRP